MNRMNESEGITRWASDEQPGTSMAQQRNMNLPTDMDLNIKGKGLDNAPAQNSLLQRSLWEVAAEDALDQVATSEEQLEDGLGIDGVRVQIPLPLKPTVAREKVTTARRLKRKKKRKIKKKSSPIKVEDATPIKNLKKEELNVGLEFKQLQNDIEQVHKRVETPRARNSSLARDELERYFGQSPEKIPTVLSPRHVEKVPVVEESEELSDNGSFSEMNFDEMDELVEEEEEEEEEQPIIEEKIVIPEKIPPKRKVSEPKKPLWQEAAEMVASAHRVARSMLDNTPVEKAKSEEDGIEEEVVVIEEKEKEEKPIEKVEDAVPKPEVGKLKMGKARARDWRLIERKHLAVFLRLCEEVWMNEDLHKGEEEPSSFADNATVTSTQSTKRTLTEDQFVSTLRHVVLGNDDQLHDLFKRVDANDRGRITTEQFLYFLVHESKVSTRIRNKDPLKYRLHSTQMPSDDWRMAFSIESLADKIEFMRGFNCFATIGADRSIRIWDSSSFKLVRTVYCNILATRGSTKQQINWKKKAHVPTLLEEERERTRIRSVFFTPGTFAAFLEKQRSMKAEAYAERFGHIIGDFYVPPEKRTLISRLASELGGNRLSSNEVKGKQKRTKSGEIKVQKDKEEGRKEKVKDHKKGGGDDGAVRYVSMTTGFRKKAVVPSAVCSIDDSGLMAVACLDRTVRLFEAKSLEFIPVGRLTVEKVPLSLAHAVSGDLQSCLVVGDVEGKVHVYSLETKMKLSTHANHKGPATCAVSIPKLGVAFGGVDGVISVLESDRWITARFLKAHNKGVSVMRCSMNGEYLLSGGLDRVIHLWNPLIVDPIGQLQGHSGAIVGLDISDELDQIYSLSSDGCVRVWDIRTLDCVQVLNDESVQRRTELSNISSGVNLQKTSAKVLPELTCCSFDPDNSRLFVCGSVCRAWEVRGIADETDLTVNIVAHASEISVRERLTGIKKGSKVLDAKGKKDEKKKKAFEKSNKEDTKPHFSPIVGLGYSEELSNLISVSSDGQVCIWDMSVFPPVSMTEFIARHEGIPHPTLSSACLDTSTRRLITAGLDGSIACWNYSSGNCLFYFREGGDTNLYPSEISGMGYLTGAGVGRHPLIGISPQSRYVASWMDPFLAPKRHTGVNMRILASHANGVVNCITPTVPCQFASGGSDGRLILWKVDATSVIPRTELRVEKHKEVSVELLCFVPSVGDRPDIVAAATNANCVHLYDLQGKPVIQHPITVSKAAVVLSSMACSRDGTKLILGDTCGGLYVLELEKYTVSSSWMDRSDVSVTCSVGAIVIAQRTKKKVQIFVTADSEGKVSLHHLNGNLILDKLVRNPSQNYLKKKLPPFSSKLIAQYKEAQEEKVKSMVVSKSAIGKLETKKAKKIGKKKSRAVIKHDEFDGGARGDVRDFVQGFISETVVDTTTPRRTDVITPDMVYSSVKAFHGQVTLDENSVYLSDNESLSEENSEQSHVLEEAKMSVTFNETSLDEKEVFEEKKTEESALQKKRNLARQRSSFLGTPGRLFTSQKSDFEVALQGLTERINRIETTKKEKSVKPSLGKSRSMAQLGFAHQKPAQEPAPPPRFTFGGPMGTPLVPPKPDEDLAAMVVGAQEEILDEIIKPKQIFDKKEILEMIRRKPTEVARGDFLKPIVYSIE